MHPVSEPVVLLHQLLWHVSKMLHLRLLAKVFSRQQKCTPMPHRKNAFLYTFAESLLIESGQSMCEYVVLPVQVTDRTVHWIPDTDGLGLGYHIFASEYVADEIFMRLFKTERRKLKKFFQSRFEGTGRSAAVRWRLIESYVHLMLPRGSIYELICKQVTTHDSIEIAITVHLWTLRQDSLIW